MPHSIEISTARKDTTIRAAVLSRFLARTTAQASDLTLLAAGQRKSSTRPRLRSHREHSTTTVQNLYQRTLECAELAACAARACARHRSLARCLKTQVRQRCRVRQRRLAVVNPCNIPRRSEPRRALACIPTTLAAVQDPIRTMLAQLSSASGKPEGGTINGGPGAATAPLDTSLIHAYDAPLLPSPPALENGAPPASHDRLTSRASNMLCCFTSAAGYYAPQRDEMDPDAGESASCSDSGTGELRVFDAAPSTWSLLRPQAPQHSGRATLVLDLDGALCVQRRRNRAATLRGAPVAKLCARGCARVAR